jgi:hypothetical protein
LIARHLETSIREIAMTMFMREPLFAIGRGLQAEYLPAVRQPLPSELEDLLAQLVALEAARRAAAEPEVSQPTLALPRPRP